MFCRRCGRQVPNGAKECIYCRSKDLTPFAPYSGGNDGYSGNQYQGESKSTVGVLMSLFLGLIGLCIGLLMYPANSYERQTFLKGWTKCFVICLLVIVIPLILLVSCATCASLASL